MNPRTLLALVVLALLSGACAAAQPTATPTATATSAAVATVPASTAIADPPALATTSDGAETAVPTVADAPTAAPAQALPTLPPATPSRTAPVTATTAAQPQPPSPPAASRLAEARHLHDNGDYAAARALYADIIRQQPDTPDAQQARWLLGQAYLDDNQWTEAFVALNEARQTVPAEALPPQVDFWLGEILEQLGNPAGAVEAYRRYLDREDILAGPVNLRIGRLLHQSDDGANAIAALNEAVAKAPDNFVLFAAREELAAVYQDLGDLTAAVAQLDQILAVSQFARYRSEIQARTAELLEKAGQTEAAIQRYRQAIAEDEKSPFALQAADALAALGQPVDDYQRARILIGAGYPAEGIALMNRYLDSTADHPVEPHLLIAEIYFGQREYERALGEWQKVLDTHADYADRATVLIRMAVAQWRLGNSAAARDLYKQAAATSPGQAAAALLEAARVAERDGDCQTAATEYLDVARLHPAAADAGEALYRGGLCQYRLGQLTDALVTWQRLVSEYATNTYAHAGRFWAGKAALELGQVEQAKSQWQGLAGEAADSYYTARAAQLAQQAGLTLAGDDRVATAQQSGAAGQDEGALLAEAEQWLAGWAAPNVSNPATLRELPAALAADPQWQRGEAYLRLDLRGEALREFDALRERFKDDPLALYSLALRFRDLGLYRNATLAAVRLAAISPDGLFGAPLFIQRLAYPTYFADLVEAEAQARNIDPLLLYALIRQESFFERGARSYAAAQGLTQVIPSTAEWIADALGWSDFQADDIYKPYVNIKFGTYYLWAALDMFNGDPYPALVGYNAGPGNARHWLEQADSNDPDLFVEEITLNEPKLYVRRVLAQYDTYRRLYANGQ